MQTHLRSRKNVRNRHTEKKLWKKKFQRVYHLGRDTTLKFGIQNGTDLESWDKILYSMMNRLFSTIMKKRLGWMNLFFLLQKTKKSTMDY